MSADDALSSVREAFQGKRGKVLLIGGGIAIAGYVYWTRIHGSTPAATPAPVDATSTGGSGGAGGPSPQTDPTVGNTTTGSGTRKYANNADWLADAVDFLKGRGVPAGSAYDALSKALAGLQITDQEKAWVSQAIGGLGSPPDGMPPLNSSPPATSGSVALKAPTGLHVTDSNTSQITVDWNPVNGAKGYKVLVNGRQNGNSVLYSNATARYLKKGTRYTIGVQAIGSGDKLGPIASISASTKSK